MVFFHYFVEVYIPDSARDRIPVKSHVRNHRSIIHHVVGLDGDWDGVHALDTGSS